MKIYGFALLLLAVGACNEGGQPDPATLRVEGAPTPATTFTQPVHSEATLPDEWDLALQRDRDSLAAYQWDSDAELDAAVNAAEVRRIAAKLQPGGSFKYQGDPYSAIRVDPGSLKIGLHWKNAGGEKYTSIHKLKADLEQQGREVVMITNAGMYLPDNSPQGLFIESGKQLVPLDTAQGPPGRTLNFYLHPNGVFYIGEKGPRVVQTGEFPQGEPGITLATQSGPMLVIHGQVHPKFTPGSTNTNIRSGVGINKEGDVVFAISDRPVNFHDFATLFRDALGCNDALYLDGAISQMYLPHSRRQDLGGDFGAIVAVTRDSPPK
jgi:uncharacterized protein YigE (DUF2233 family)